jgi:hypothetical protein
MPKEAIGYLGKFGGQKKARTLAVLPELKTRLKQNGLLLESITGILSPPLTGK